ncbi:hypothetical protein B1B04_23560 [Lysinibacillus sp. KCTC 33748]|uniref:hypothetical protein n=1 Tax=unclassified Lysinibacillus TaxID=2636778 RepID=UPI0009A76D53|nr:MULTISPECIES: hypothetical protein [unclassified Lysinibacillus]OXS66920.1 hypothetical protein B1B04_23560 [Lysinibacillus sp. KCTC 33748]SKC16660.1 hypothetical protein SAMN06295926_13235 [Lysinibacillus sp. AC-3]
MIVTTIFFFTSILLVIAIFQILSKLGKKTKRIWTPKRIMIGITSYIILGLTAFIYISFFSDSKIPVLSSSDIKQVEKKFDQIPKYDQEFNSSYLTSDYKKKTWEINFDGDTLPVVINNDDNNLSLNIRQRYNDNIESGKALITYYQFPFIVNGVDLSDEVPLPDVYVAQNQLFIESFSKQQVNYNRLKATIGFLDFNRGAERYEMDNSYSNFIVIDIPRGTEIEDSQGLIYYLE